MGTVYARPVSTKEASPLFALMPVYRAPLPLGQAREHMDFFFGVGTGGAATPDYLRGRGDKGYWSAAFSPIIQAIGEAVPDREPKECLEHVIAVLKPAVTELASALGVSRQAIYAWLRGKAVSSANAARLAELAQAADMVAVEGAAAATQIVRRPLKGGKSFFSLLKEGVAADDAARLLIEVIRAESHEREVLNKHFAGRARPSRESFEGIGVPRLDERG